jgi:radical SAM superfamily enzyme YgiQ (UPF0313 family)
MTTSCNVLLVFPKFNSKSFWSFEGALHTVGARYPAPPLGLITVAAMLPPDWCARLVNRNTEELTDADLDWADMVMTGGMHAQQADTQSIIGLCRARQLPVVVGGPDVTSSPHVYGDADFRVVGEAEDTLPAFIAAWRRGERHGFFEAPRFQADVRQTPIPRFDLLKFDHYLFIGVQFSRGCPFDCEFCNITALYGHRPRVKTADQIIAELEGFYQMGWRGRVLFVDDNLIGNRRYLKEELLPAIIRWRQGKTGRMGMPFNTEASINLADDAELMRLMVDAGFDEVFIGIETPEESSLIECNKKQNVGRDLVEDVKRIQRAGLEVQGGFILGFDSDTPSTFQRQIDFIQRSGIVTAMVGLLQAPPATRLWRRMEAEGRLLGVSTGNNVEAATNIVPIMPLDTLYEGYKEVLGHLYSPEQYYERAITFLREVKPPKFSSPIDAASARAFFRSIGRLGIVGKERVQYWKLFFWTLGRRPQLLPVAITIAIYGYHFRLLSEAL